MEAKVGIEAEYLLFNKEGAVVVPPRTWDRDGFPVLGEIRGLPGKTVPETVAYFEQARLSQLQRLKAWTSNDGHVLQFMDMVQLPLSTYREANAQTNWATKGQKTIQNIYGTDINDFSDQVTNKGKITGVNVSCGLHIHFSCQKSTEVQYDEWAYEPVTLPLTLATTAKNGPQFTLGVQLFQRTQKDPKKIKATVSVLNQPTIHWLVEQMDKLFFERFAPPPRLRTKFRQPGFWEAKSYGFEYRSLPCNQATLNALPEIVEAAFDLLEQAME